MFCGGPFGGQDSRGRLPSAGEGLFFPLGAWGCAGSSGAMGARVCFLSWCGVAGGEARLGRG